MAWDQVYIPINWGGLGARRKKSYLMAWDQVRVPTDWGGLGVSRLRDVNVSLFVNGCGH